jgi:MFS family permease
LATAADQSAPPPVAHTSFAALRHPGFQMYFLATAAAMAADNTEHVISYWVMFQKFHSPTLLGFAVISHWLPFLAFSVYSGALADRFDPRRIIQLGMVLFAGVSIAWGVLFSTGLLQPWHARILLIIHGCAGVLWGPASQLLLHDIVGPAELPSAVRLGATARYLGTFSGPAIGAALLLWLGPSHAIFLNAVIYLPMILWLWRAPYGPRFRKESPTPARTVRGFGEVFATFRVIRENPTVLCMTFLAGGTAFFIGNAYQAQMPGFAQDLGHGDPGFSYSALLAADAFGALAAGFVLELGGLLRPASRTALLLALGWCCALGGFALIPSYWLALTLLFCAGFLELSYNSMAQALVQLSAPAAIRGRVIGVFSMAANGMKTFSGVMVGMVGGLIGIHYSLSLSAVAVFVTVGCLLAFSAHTHTLTAGQSGR